MSWRDDSNSSNRSGTNDGSGGSRNGSGGVSGTGGGSGGGWGSSRDGGGGRYTYRGMGKGKGKQGNWNTGGKITGFGSLGGGIMPVGGMNPRHMGPQPAAGPIGPMVQPPMPPPAYPPVSGPPTRPDLNPATLAPWTGVGMPGPVRMDPGILGQMMQGLNPKSGFSNPAGNYPAQYNGGGPGNSFAGVNGYADPSKGYGNDMFGASMGGFRGGGGGRKNGAGNGFGGGGGGGW